DLNAILLQSCLGAVVRVRGDCKSVMYAPLPFRIWLDRRFTLAKDDVVLAGLQEHHLELRCIEDLLQAEHFGIKPTASFEIAHRDTEMHHAPRFYRTH